MTPCFMLGGVRGGGGGEGGEGEGGGGGVAQSTSTMGVDVAKSTKFITHPG